MEIGRKRKRCLSMSNTTTMDKCTRYVSKKKDICGVHKRRKLIYLPDGSVWKNPHKSNKLESCIKNRPPLKFWDVIRNGVHVDQLNLFYSPEIISNLRIEKISYLKKELTRLHVDIGKTWNNQNFNYRTLKP